MNRDKLSSCLCSAPKAYVDAYHMLIEDCYFVRCDFCDRHTDEFDELSAALQAWKVKELVD